MYFMTNQTKPGHNRAREAASSMPLLEVVDRDNIPFMAAPTGVVHKQGLLHRSVVVTLYNTENKLFMRKRTPEKHYFPGKWDVSASGHVFAGESTMDAGLRLVENILGLDVNELRLVHEIPADISTGNEFVYIYTAGKMAVQPVLNPREALKGYYYNKEELGCMIEEFRELLSPSVATLWSKDVLF